MIPKIIDLFSGCGGLTLGFERVGFEIAGGIELMPSAHSTLSFNFYERYGKSCEHICGDITQINGNVFEDKIGEEGCIVIGGPPCQAYSLAGRGKLKSLGENRENTKDARGYLYQDFLRFAYSNNAKAVVMENVPEAISFGSMNIPQIVCEDLDAHGYNAFWTILNSADYGVPQIRERLFVIAVRKELNVNIELPIPTHRDTSGLFMSQRANSDRLNKYSFYKEPIVNIQSQIPWVTVEQALSDLPSLQVNADARYRNNECSLALPYKPVQQNDYQLLMRSWYGKSNVCVTGNSYRNNTRDFHIFEEMQEGENYVDAHRIAEKHFEAQAHLLGYSVTDEQYQKLHKKMVPCYDTTKFVDKWKRLRRDMPSHTIVAHLSVDTYSHIHPWEPRGISVREAARLQSFPDGFLFNCSMGDAFKQIGNAVPPLLSYAIAKSLYNAFKI